MQGKRGRGSADMAEWLEDGRMGVKAQLRYERMSAFKVRPVLDLVRGKPVGEAQDILARTPRAAAGIVAKVIASAASNAENNDFLNQDELYVDTCFADEANTLKRWRPRARGRATRIRKRMCHITVVVARLPEDKLAEMQKSATTVSGSRARRVLASRRSRKAESNIGDTGAVEEQLNEGQVAQEVGTQELEVQEASVHEVDVQSAEVEDSVVSVVEEPEQANDTADTTEGESSDKDVSESGDDLDDTGNMSNHVEGQE